MISRDTHLSAEVLQENDYCKSQATRSLQGGERA